MFLRLEIPPSVDAQVQRQSTDKRQSEVGATEDIRNDMQMEALGNHRAQYPGRPHTHLHTGYATRLRLIHDADTERQVVRMDEEKDQENSRTV